MCCACYLEPNPNPFSTGILWQKSLKTIDLFKKRHNKLCIYTKHLFRPLCVVFVCSVVTWQTLLRYLSRSPKVGHFQRAAWHGQIQLAAQLRTRPSWELHLVCGHGMISRTPWLRGYKNIVYIYTKNINPSFFSACLIFGAHFALRILKNESSLYVNALLPKKSRHVKSQQASTGSKMSPG